MKYLLSLLILISMCAFSQDSVEKEKRGIILEFIVGDELKTASESFFERQIQNIKYSHPELTDSVWDNVRMNVDAKFTFLDTVVALYQSKLTIEELREIKRIFSLPTMMKIKKVGAEVMESFPTMAVKCGRDIMNKIKDYLDKKFPKTK